MNQTKKNVSTKPRKKKKKASSKQKQQSVRFVLIGVVILTAVLIILGALVFSADKVISDESVSSENSELLSTVSSDEMGFPVTFSNNDIIPTSLFLKTITS